LSAYNLKCFFTHAGEYYYLKLGMILKFLQLSICFEVCYRSPAQHWLGCLW